MGMRSVKNTSLNFGLVNVGVKLYKATDSHDISFNLFHAGCEGAIGQPRVCKKCGVNPRSDEVIKGKLVDDDKIVVITDDDLAQLQEANKLSAIEVVQFCHSDEIDPIMWESSYFLEPTDNSSQGYALLRRVMVESDVVAVAKFVLRTRQQMAVIRVLGNVLVMHTLIWLDEIRDANGLQHLNGTIESPKMLEMAHAVVDSMIEDFSPANFVDTYTAQVAALIDTKAKGGVLTSVVDLDQRDDDVSDLMAQLEASVKRHPAGKTPAKKAAPKKAPAKRAAPTRKVS